MLKEKDKGILLIATGHPYYGRMAYNMACSIKGVEEFPVAVATDGKALSHLSLNQMEVFDEVVQIPEEYGRGFAAKLYLNELTPFKKTLYMDVDMLWLPFRSPSDFFEQFKNIEFTGITEGWYDYSTPEDKSHINDYYYFWADLEEIRKVYDLKGKIYQWRTEVVYLTNTKAVDKFYKKAQAIHRRPKLATIRTFGETTPDELAVNISASLNDIHPHAVKWTPAYWHRLQNNIVPQLWAMKEWYMVGFGGNYAGGAVTRLYDQVMMVAMRQLGRQHVFRLHPKKHFLTERNKM